MNILQLQEFFIEGGDRRTSHVLLHIAEPASLEEKKKGYFFALCDLNQSEDEDIVYLQNLIDKIENIYYENVNTETSVFEEVLSQANRDSYVLTNKNIDLHCIVGVLKQEEIFFAAHGSPLMLLFYHNKNNGLYKTMDLVDKDQKDAHPRQLFSQVVQGKISPGDYMLVATSHVGDYFNTDRLTKIIPARPVKQSAQHLERVLLELKNKLSFGGLLIHLQPDTEQKNNKTSLAFKGGSEKSLHDLFATEQKTASTLTTAFIPNLSNKIKDIITRENNTATPRSIATIKPEETISPAEINAEHAHQVRSQPKHSHANQLPIWSYLQIIGLASLWFAKKLFLFIWWFATTVLQFIYSSGRFFILLFLMITNIRKQRRLIWENWRQQWRACVNGLKNLPLFTKILLIAITTLIVIFLVSILIIRTNHIEQAAQKLFNETIQKITTAKDAAESYLIYKNDTAALTELQNAQILLSNLNCVERNNICTNLNTELENLLVKIRKIAFVRSELIVDWNEYPNTITKIIKIKNKIVAIIPDTGKILIYNLLTKEKSVIELTDKLKTIATNKENDYALILTQDNTFWRFTPDNNTISKITITFPQTNVLIQDSVIYNRRLYTLDTLNQQIYKHENNRDGFNLGQEWLQEKNNVLNNGAHMTIDGDIFIAAPTGALSKFTKGEKQIFTINGLDPILKNIADIWTYNDIEDIYILDNTEKRLIILDKNGVLKMQIRSDSWRAPTGLAVGEDKKQIYILDQNKLYSLILP